MIEGIANIVNDGPIEPRATLLGLPVVSGAMREESAAQHIVSRIPVARRGDLVAAAIAALTGRSFDVIDALYVVDDDNRLIGGVPLVDLFGAPGDRCVETLADAESARVGPHHDQEHVAAEALARGASSVAVVDDEGRLIGVVPPTALLAILQREHVEDLHRLAGIQREATRDHDAFDGPPSRRARHRFPWLLVGLVGSLIAAFVVSRFEKILEHQLAVAFFVPTIVYFADAIGTQTEAIAVRGLSLGRLPLGRLLFGEMRTGLLIGATLALLALPIVTLMFDGRLGMSVALAILIAGGVATTLGLVLPWVLQRLGSDPAFGSGPLATIIQDVLSIAIYFAIVTRLMM